MAPFQIDWLNANSLRTYPFQDDMSLRPIGFGDSIRIPDSMFLDFNLSVFGGTGHPKRIYLRSLLYSVNTIRVVFSEVGGDDIAFSDIDLSKHVMGDPYDVFGLGSQEDARGMIVVGDQAVFEPEMPYGNYEFDKSSTLIDSGCILCTPVYVRRLISSTIGTHDLSKNLYGDVRLMAGDNVVLLYSPDTNAITISTLPPDTGDTDIDTGEIVSINGIHAKDVQIVGDGSCINIERDGNTIKIKDTCSQPCCGCAELTYINQKINEMTSSFRRIVDSQTRLSEKTNELSNLLKFSTR